MLWILLIHLSQLISDRFVIVFFLALLDLYLIFQIAIIIALFIYFLFFFSEYILPGSVFWGLWSPRNYKSLNLYIVFITRITLSQSHQFPLTNKQCSVAQLQADWTSAPNSRCCLSSCFLAVLATFLTIVRREKSKMFLSTITHFENISNWSPGLLG